DRRFVYVQGDPIPTLSPLHIKISSYVFCFPEQVLEWILMEKIDGHTLDSVIEAGLSMGQKQRVYRNVARWVHQLSTLRFDKIGSLYCRWNPLRNPILSDFYLGPSSDFQFAYDYRQEYNIPRGPYDSVRDYLRGFVEIYQAETLDPRQHKRSQFWDLFNDFESQGTMHSKRQDLQLWPSLYSKSDLERIPQYCQSLRYVIPLIVKETTLPPRSTFLHHFDMSYKNIIVDREGVPIALLDWEQITTRPFSFGFPLPRFFIDQDYITTTRSLETSTTIENLRLKQDYLEYLQEFLSPNIHFVDKSNILDEEFEKLCEITYTIPESVQAEGYQFVSDVIAKRGMAWLDAPGLEDWKKQSSVDTNSPEFKQLPLDQQDMRTSRVTIVQIFWAWLCVLRAQKRFRAIRLQRLVQSERDSDQAQNSISRSSSLESLATSLITLDSRDSVLSKSPQE
ncbi:uncharacterized protein LY89DRAFT_751839, partial [Mollisia scopiformis]